VSVKTSRNCVQCGSPMVRRIENVNYTKMAGLRGKRVMLRDVVTLSCTSKPCGRRDIELRQAAGLHRELAATRALKVAQIYARHEGNDIGWVIEIPIQ